MSWSSPKDGYASLSPPRLQTVVRILCFILHQTACSANIMQEIKYIWPTALFSRQMFKERDFPMMQRLARIAEAGFDRFVQESLPEQLSADPAFRDEYENGDLSRTNVAFLHWQKHTYEEHTKNSAHDLDHKGERMPKYPNVRYQWPELYGSQDYRSLKKKIGKVTIAFSQRISKEHDLDERDLQVFVWAEVYRRDEFQYTHVHTGAVAAGIVAVQQGDGDAGQQVAFVDARGDNAPFGHRHTVRPALGQSLVFPAWAPHFVVPHSNRNAINVLLNFLVWGSGGPMDFDWEDDPTGNFVSSRKTYIKQHRDPVTSAGGASAAAGEKQPPGQSSHNGPAGDPASAPPGGRKADEL